MKDEDLLGGQFRKLWPTDTPKFRDHLLRLDPESRRLRFAHTVSDDYIEEYAAHMNDMGSVVHAFVQTDGEVRACAELKKLGYTWDREAEAAFSVEKEFQKHGIGTKLMGRVIRSARNRGIQTLCLSCLSENAKMQMIARKYQAELRFEYGEVTGEIVPKDPNYFSVLTEAVEDRVGFMMAVLDLQARALKAAA